jgi:RimJ/RimL family protein N-acetyltransferase
VAGLLPIATRRLVLRPMVADDATAFATYRSDPDVARFQGWQAPYPLESARRLIAGQAEMEGPVAGQWIQIAVTLDGQLAGDVAVGLDADGLIATLGYTLAPTHQGRGLATEAVGAIVDRLFDDVGVHRIEASLDPDNVPSARLLERLGFTYEGTALSAVLVGQEWVDDVRYALTVDARAAWAARPRHRPEEVRLVAITPDNAGAVLRLTTHRSQQRFVAPMPESFADALAPEPVNGVPVVPWYRAIEADGELTGFVMLAERTAAHPEPFLLRLLIDRRHQRRGIGDRVITLLAERLRAEGHRTLLVSWHPGEGGPEPFYLARGFVPTGTIEEGEIEARLTL